MKYSDFQFKLINKLHRIIFGEARYLDFLIYAIKKSFDLKFLREWVNTSSLPHFYDQRHNVIDLAFGNAQLGPFPFYRGFYTSEVIKEGDRVLDIGCGDGFFTMRFYAPKAKKVDAIDIEPSAIEMAKDTNQNSKIQYILKDAVKEDFPSPEYDVIVFDGAIGHLSKEDSKILLKKIKNSLSANGLFVGSESLGLEGHDHLQFFNTMDDLRSLLSSHFRYVSLKSVDYVNNNSGFKRKEAYWRCSNSLVRFHEFSWHNNF